MLSSLALVVVIVIDQFRADELLRAQKNFNPAGIGLLVNKGVFYDDAHHSQFFNMTCPGHTAISTGAMAGLHGIMINSDWDNAKQKRVYCVSDDTHHWLESPDDQDTGANLGTSAKRILVTTIGDETKALWKNESEVVSVSVKDRAAIALGGHSADGVYFYAPKSQKWTTSDAYLKGPTLPPWVKDFNKSHTPKKKYDEDEYESSPLAIDDSVTMALAAAKAHNLGHHAHPDILFISFSTHDYVGHKTGDNSDTLRATLKIEDNAIANLLNGLKKNLGNKKILVALTADHGAGVDLKDVTGKNPIPGGKQNQKAVTEKVSTCLASDGIKLSHLEEMNFFLNSETKNKTEAREKLRACVLQIEGVWHAFTRDEILGGHYPQTPWLKNLGGSYNPERGPDVIGVLKPYWNSRDHDVVNHETPYDYDNWVPLALWWPGVKSKTIHKRVEVLSLAPTLSRLLLTRRPSGSSADYLTDVLDEALR